MRSLTRAEATLVGALLANAGGTQEQQIRELGLPRRTYQTARDRVLRRGWVVERAVPDVRQLDLPTVTVTLGHPFLDSLPEVARRWRSLPGVVALWQGAECLLAVRCSARPVPVEEWVTTGPPTFRHLVAVEIDLRHRGIPIFFDFEGAWSRLTGTSCSPGYPRGFGTTRPPGGEGSDPVRGGPVLRELLAEPSSGASVHVGRSLLRTALDRRRLDRARARGWISIRSFLDPTAVGDSVDGVGDQVAFVTATLAPGADGDAVLRELMRRARLAPFLYVHDGHRLVLGVLTADRLASERRAGDAESAFAVLRESASEIATFREPVHRLQRTIDLRFDRLLDSTGNASASGE
jgi:hypothetical protein